MTVGVECGEMSHAKFDTKAERYHLNPLVDKNELTPQCCAFTNNLYFIQLKTAIKPLIQI
jgi:hypothetical protein